MQLFSWTRIAALIQRYSYLDTRNINRVFQVTMWPMIDIMMFGFITLWIQKDSISMGKEAVIPVVGMLFWQIVVRSQQAFPVDLIEELASKNLVNMFSSPLRFGEWICAVMIFSIARMFVVFVLGSGLLWTLYACNIFMFGWWLFPIIFLLLLSGWFFGFITAAIIMHGGQRMSAFAWASWILTPFCGAFSPLEVIPHWMQLIGKLLPMTYTFMAIHNYIITGTMSCSLLLMSLIMNGIWLGISFIVFVALFKRAQRRGLSRLEVD